MGWLITEYFYHWKRKGNTVFVNVQSWSRFSPNYFTPFGNFPLSPVTTPTHSKGSAGLRAVRHLSWESMDLNGHLGGSRAVFYTRSAVLVFDFQKGWKQTTAFKTTGLSAWDIWKNLILGTWEWKPSPTLKQRQQQQQKKTQITGWIIQVLWASFSTVKLMVFIIK